MNKKKDQVCFGTNNLLVTQSKRKLYSLHIISFKNTRLKHCTKLLHTTTKITFY